MGVGAESAPFRPKTATVRGSPPSSLFPSPPQVLLRFRSEAGRDPSPQHYAGDAERLLRLRREVLEQLGLGPELLPEDFVR